MQFLEYKSTQIWSNVHQQFLDWTLCFMIKRYSLITNNKFYRWSICPLFYTYWIMHIDLRIIPLCTQFFVGKTVKRLRKWKEAAAYRPYVARMYANRRLQMYIDIWFVFTRFCVYLSCTKKSQTLISLGSLKLEWYC